MQQFTVKYKDEDVINFAFNADDNEGISKFIQYFRLPPSLSAAWFWLNDETIDGETKHKLNVTKGETVIHEAELTCKPEDALAFVNGLNRNAVCSIDGLCFNIWEC